MSEKFRCPGCRKRLQAAQLVLEGEAGSFHCPWCHSVVLQAAPARSRSIALLRRFMATGCNAKGAHPSARDRVRDALLFSLFLFNFCFALYTCFFSANLSVALSIILFRYRPIGWAREGILVAVLLLGAAWLLLTIPPFILLMRRTAKSALTWFLVLLASALPFIPLHLHVVQPFFTAQLHLENWPVEVALVNFAFCADQFESQNLQERLIASGKMRVEIENRSLQRIREAAFTVKAGQATDYWQHNTQYRIVFRDVYPGQRVQHISRRYLGAIVYNPSTSAGGSGRTVEAHPQILWDSVLFEDRAAPKIGARPDNAIAEITDCPGHPRPDLPWYQRPWLGPEDAIRRSRAKEAFPSR